VQGRYKASEGEQSYCFYHYCRGVSESCSSHLCDALGIELLCNKVLNRECSGINAMYKQSWITIYWKQCHINLISKGTPRVLLTCMNRKYKNNTSSGRKLNWWNNLQSYSWSISDKANMKSASRFTKREKEMYRWVK
jgi:hypothetical protein